MTTRNTIIPANNSPGKVIAWDLWLATSDTEWRIETSAKVTLAELPFEGWLAVRFYYEKRLKSDPTKRYSTACYGWDYYALQAHDRGERFELWRSDNLDELQAATSLIATIGYGFEVTDEAWADVHAEIHGLERAAM